MADPDIKKGIVSVRNCELIPAMITPFQADGSVDHDRLGWLASHLIQEQACDGLLVNGTTGESPTLSADEKLQTVKTVSQALATTSNKGHVPLMVGVGSNDTHKAVDEAKTMAAIADVAALLVVTPYYNKPSQAGLLAHFGAVAEAVPGTEIVVYNIPGRCGVEIAPATLAELHRRWPNIIGVKQSVADLDTLSMLRAMTPPESFFIWCGDDSLTLPMLACGGTGVVSVLAHLAGKPIRAMIQAYKKGQVAEARQLHLTLHPFARALFTLPNPTIVKTAMALKHSFDGRLRLPMVPPNELTAIQDLLNGLKTFEPVS